ncbi:glycosyltransferase family 2 protein [Flavobacteriaceae bacterium 144Ye]|nr:glycosyltransferase family 2 protein [Flavobacteriaceae bacterium 144Ye]
MNKTDLISIIIPTYNRAHLIGATLDSIAAQSYADWECLVIDDGSTDDTAAVVGGYVAADARFQYHERPVDRPKGANACRNYGFALSKGAYINWFDSDDVMMVDKLAKQIDVLHSEGTNYCISQTMWVDKESGEDIGLRASAILSSQPLEDYMCFTIFWSILAPLWRRTFIEAHALQFDERLQQSQEYDFHIKALAIDSKYSVIHEPLAKMFKHEHNISHNWLYSDAKVTSNIVVKYRALKGYHEQLSLQGQVKVLEMVTLLYKDLLTMQRFAMAKYAYQTLLGMLPYVGVGRLTKFMFSIKVLVIYYSYRIFGKGYNLLKPISVE